ncbi:hypothetical protein AAG570_007465 [Ranatra chinensis]|uniref:CCHC-type domain-containing protein n=1 Tax=Ranatra chinensis TaxID=642074 RepID=A0ABD0XYM0_9HEMI
MSELPEKLRRQLKTLGDSNFGVLLAQVDEEEDDYQAAREDASSWTRVEWRSTRRPDRGRERLRCWECGSTRHLARVCPQIYRRDQREAGRRPRPEPMEVNAVRGPRRNYLGGERSYASAASSGSFSSSYDYSSDEDWPGLPQRAQRRNQKVAPRSSGATTRPRFEGPGGGQ